MRSLREPKALDHPADEVPEPPEHGRNLIETRGSKTGSKSFILRVHDILMRDRGEGICIFLVLRRTHPDFARDGSAPIFPTTPQVLKIHLL
jgi:hypothetical protein